MTARILLILLLLPSICYAGPGARRFMGAGGAIPSTIQTTINGVSGLSGSTQSTGVESGIQFVAGSPGVQVDYSGVGDDITIKMDGSTCATIFTSGSPGTLSCNTTTHTGTLEVTITGTAAVVDNFRVKVRQ
jgi:hypothetical protein